jgi:hypothetical protein
MSETIPPIGSSPTAPKTSALAIWSLVLGILSLICCTIFAAIPGVICGHKALSRIKQSGGVIQGRGLAIGGLITGYLGMLLAIALIPMMIGTAIPAFTKARETAQKIACIVNQQQIDAAKKQWADKNNKQPTDVPTESDLAPYLPGGHMPKCPTGGTYKINAVGEKATCSNPAHKIEPQQ